MRLRVGVESNVGLVRQLNEDSYLVHGGLLAVCDGMGGARAGEVASEMACAGLLEVDPKTSGPEELLVAVKRANQAIVERSLEDHGLRGMGTTLTAALAGDEKLIIAHVGDSRAYLLHEGGLRQLTDDHSWVAEMIRRGDLTPTEAAVHPHRSIITKALGTDVEIDPDLVETPFVAGDRLLLCSDGLTGMVSDDDIARILSGDEEPQLLAALLVQGALAGGGEDNVTVLVAEALPELSPEEGLPETASGEGTAPGEDEPLLGPADRGVASPRGRGLPLKGLHSRVAVRERLGLGRHSGEGSSSEAGSGEAGDPPGEDAEPAQSGAADTEGTLKGAGVEAGSPESRRSRWRRRRWWITAVIALLVVAAAIAVFAVVNSTVYYVGQSGDKVALFRGLPGDVAGIELSDPIEEGTVSYDSLPAYIKERIDAHELVTKEEGQKFLRSLSAAP